MRLIYIKGKHPNFGDDLNEELWPALAPGLFDDDRRQGFLGIGTVIGHPYFEADYLHVFSSGVGYDRVEGWNIPRTVWCVRGPLSAELMREPPSKSLTDGAILAPAAFDIAASPDRAGVGVIPHWESELCGGWLEACESAGFDLISPARAPREVMAHIGRKTLILTESLHGAIIADALGVPWIAFASTGNFSFLKWADWSLSLGIKATIHPVPAPSGKALIKFGRFSGGRSRAPVELSRELALADYQSKMMWLGSSHERKRASLKAAAKRLLVVPPIARVAGISPDKTGKALLQVVKSEPNLSDSSLRSRLCEQMLSRLTALKTELGR